MWHRIGEWLHEGRSRTRDERGATVLEWALIAAAVVMAASIISAAIFQVVNDKADDLERCAGSVTAECADGAGGRAPARAAGRRGGAEPAGWGAARACRRRGAPGRRRG